MASWCRIREGHHRPSRFLLASEQLRNRLHAVIHERDRPAAGAGELVLEVDAQCVVDGGRHFRRGHRAIFRIATDLIRCAHDTAALHAAAGEQNGPALRPVVAAAGRIHLRRASELAQGHHQGRVEQATLVQLFQQGGVAVVEPNRDTVLHLRDGGERTGPVDVPGHFVEHGFKSIDGDTAHAALDHASRQQAALPEFVHAVLLAHRRRLAAEVERFAGLRAGHQGIRLLKVLIEQPRLRAGLERLELALHRVAQRLASLFTDRGDIVRRQQILNLEIRLAGIGVDDQGIIRLPQIPGALAVRQVAAGRAHRGRQHHVGGGRRLSVRTAC